MKEIFPVFDTPSIVAQTDGFIVARKPSGMHTAPGPRPDGKATLLDWLFSSHPEILSFKGRNIDEGGLVHRLDSDTSGLVLFARTQEAFDFFMQAGIQGSFIKEYDALARISIAGLEGSKPLLHTPDGIDPIAWLSSLRRNDTAALIRFLSGRGIRGVFRPFGPGGKRVACAVKPKDGSSAGKKDWTDTEYSTAVLSVQGGVSDDPCELLLKVRLIRGFRHQIRAHLAWLGLPLVGDPLYGDDTDEDARLCLNASCLRFPDPSGGAPVVIDDTIR